MMSVEQESPTAAHWSQAQYQSALATGDPFFQRVGWVAEVQEQPGIPAALPAQLGFLVAHKMDADWELENIAVSAIARRSGVGTSLLSALLTHVQAENGSAIFLEVRESNQAARGFYSHAGFEQTGVRKSYYSAPREDAVLYRRRMS